MDHEPGPLAGTGTVFLVVGRTGVVQVSGTRLRAARIAAGYRTAAALAAAMGHRDATAISRWEGGQRRPDVASLAKLAALCRVDVLDLLQPGTPVTLEILRIRAGHTQAQLADQLGISRGVWAAIERGERDLTAGELDPVAAALRVSTAQVQAASGIAPDTIPELVELPPDLVAQMRRASRDDETLADTLRRLLGSALNTGELEDE